MKRLIDSWLRRLGWSALSYCAAVVGAIWYTWQANVSVTQPLTDGDLIMRFLCLPALAAIAVLGVLTAAAVPSASAAPVATSLPVESTKPFIAQVVGVQWLNPLQRRDYPTEWQLLWTLGLVQPNANDDQVKENPKKFSTLQAIGIVADGNEGTESLVGYHKKYLTKLAYKFRDIYFSNSNYFYNAHSLKDKTSWRELAGIHVEYALPLGRLEPKAAAEHTRETLTSAFDIGNVNFPNAWSRSTPPDVHVTMGGANAGFTSLKAGLDYLRSHPNETVWVMNWDAPSFPPKDEQINENMVLLVLAGPHYKTERAPLAWLGYPSTKAVADFEAKKGQPPRAVQAWKATMDGAADNAGKAQGDVGYVIHDANNTQRDSSDRIGTLAQTLSSELVEFDFMKQSFNTPALLGEMGAGTALTNVALGIAYANHFGKNVLVAGTSDAAHPTAVLVAPPETVRPIKPDVPWFRARGENNAYLMWWGLRHDEPPSKTQGYSK